MRLQELKKIAVGNLAALVQPVHDPVVHVGRGALVHDLGLALRIKILRDVPDDPEYLALPGLQARRRLLEKVQQIFLWQPKQLAASFRVQHFRALGRPRRNGSPQVVEYTFLVQAPFSSALFFGAKIEILLAGITIDAMRHQGMRSIECLLDRLPAVTLLALRHIALGEIQIIENSVSIRPLLEEIVVLEEMVVAERRVGNHQRLHGCGIFFHQIGNARGAVDHDLICEAHKPLAIECLVMCKVLSERPMLVEQRHAGRGIGIQHLLRGDHLDLVRVDVEPEFGSRNLLARIVDALQLREVPLRSLEQACGSRGHGAAFSCFPRR